jgi:hypothetical protein
MRNTAGLIMTIVALISWLALDVWRGDWDGAHPLSLAAWVLLAGAGGMLLAGKPSRFTVPLVLVACVMVWLSLTAIAGAVDVRGAWQMLGCLLAMVITLWLQPTSLRPA